MLHRTLLSAQKEHSPAASWKTKVIQHIQLPSGAEYFRTYVFDDYVHRCKRCRKASRRGLQGRLACTSHTCDRCGNPYAAFTRQLRRKTSTGWETVKGAWTESGLLH